MSHGRYPWQRALHNAAGELFSSGYPWKYALYIITYYSSTAVYQNYISVYFKARGLSVELVGVLMAAVPLVSIFSQPLLGSPGDRMRSRNQLIRILAVCSAAAMLLLKVSGNFWWLLGLIVLFAGFYTALQPLGDAVILEALAPERIPFGPLRLTGSVIFAIGSFFIGRFLNLHISWTVYLTSIALALLFVASYALPQSAGRQREHNKVSFLTLLKQKELALLLGLFALLQITMGYFYAYFGIFYISLPGGNVQLLGLCYLISAFSELPFLLLADKLFDRIGAGKLLCIAALAVSLRWITLAVSTNVYFIMASQVLHGWGFIVMMVSMSKYISFTVPVELRARGQTLLGIIGYGVARSVGSGIGVLLADRIGLQSGFFVTAGISILALVLYAPRYLRAAPLNGMLPQ